MKFDRKTARVTGAAGNLGRAVAQAFADRGTRLVLVDVKEAMAKQDNVVHPGTSEAAAQFFRTEQERCARLVEKADIDLD